jgi:hypothetical protein
VSMIDQNIPTFSHAGHFVTLVRTNAMPEGTRVVLAAIGRESKKPVIRTVKSITETGQVSQAGSPLFAIRWAEGDTADWSAANIAHGEYLWTVVV